PSIPIGRMSRSSGPRPELILMGARAGGNIRYCKANCTAAANCTSANYHKTGPPARPRLTRPGGKRPCLSPRNLDEFLDYPRQYGGNSCCRRGELGDPLSAIPWVVPTYRTSLLAGSQGGDPGGRTGPDPAQARISCEAVTARLYKTLSAPNPRTEVRPHT